MLLTPCDISHGLHHQEGQRGIGGATHVLVQVCYQGLHLARGVKAHLDTIIMEVQYMKDLPTVLMFYYRKNTLFAE